jgi:hypothetical protein
MLHVGGFGCVKLLNHNPLILYWVRIRFASGVKIANSTSIEAASLLLCCKVAIGSFVFCFDMLDVVRCLIGE